MDTDDYEIFEQMNESDLTQESDIDLFNDDTFGEGAIESDWESDHKLFTQTRAIESLSLDVKEIGSRMQNLLKSDQLEEDIDPAIVSVQRCPVQPSIDNKSQMRHSILPNLLDSNFDINSMQTSELKSNQSENSLEFEDAAIVAAIKEPSIKKVESLNGFSEKIRDNQFKDDHSFLRSSTQSPSDLLSNLISRNKNQKPENLNESNHNKRQLQEFSRPARFKQPLLPPPPPPGVPVPYRLYPPVGFFPPSPMLRNSIHRPYMQQILPHQIPPFHNQNDWFPNRLMIPPWESGPFFPPLSGLPIPPPRRLLYGQPPFGINPRFPRHPANFMGPPISHSRDPSRFMILPMPPPCQLHPAHSYYIQSMQQRFRMTSHQRDGRRNRSQYNNNDPFDGMMTQKEKDWVVKAQMMALKSDRPEIDDYYYQNYIKRRLQQGTYDPNKPNRLVTPVASDIITKKYVPVQFTNSLGKLYVPSVYSPRPSLEISTNDKDEEEDSDEYDASQSSLSIRLVVYKIIEKAYDHLIVIREMIESAESEHLNERGLPLSGCNTKELNSLVDQMIESLGFKSNDQIDQSVFDPHDDFIFNIMKIRKGRKLFQIIIPYLHINQKLSVLQSVLAHLPNLIKRDAKDQVLLDMFPLLSKVINELNCKQLLKIVAPLAPLSIIPSLRDQIGCSIIFKLIFTGCCLFGMTPGTGSNLVNDGQEEWSKFVADVTEAVVALANSRDKRLTSLNPPFNFIEDFQTSPAKILACRSNREQKSIEIALSRFIIC